jgi:hypothetical protein
MAGGGEGGVGEGGVEEGGRLEEGVERGIFEIPSL